jgi:hypothetical protein
MNGVGDTTRTEVGLRATARGAAEAS